MHPYALKFWLDDAIPSILYRFLPVFVSETCGGWWWVPHCVLCLNIPPQAFKRASICNSSWCAHARHVSLICSLFYACVFAPSTQEFMTSQLTATPLMSSAKKGFTRGYFTTLGKFKLLYNMYNPHFPVVERGRDGSQTYICGWFFAGMTWKMLQHVWRHWTRHVEKCCEIEWARTKMVWSSSTNSFLRWKRRSFCLMHLKHVISCLFTTLFGWYRFRMFLVAQIFCAGAEPTPFFTVLVCTRRCV